jgi:hypothetical protein
MPSQSSPLKIGVWPLALATLLHAFPWWVMHSGGSGEGLRQRVMQMRAIQLAPNPIPNASPELGSSDLARGILALPPDHTPAVPTAAQPTLGAIDRSAPRRQTVAPQPATAPASLTSPPMSLAPSPRPANVDAQPPASSEPEPASLQSPDSGNGHPPGWIFDPESYTPAEDLDQPPQLVGDWVLNEAAVPRLAKDRPSRIHVVVRMWVSADGHLDIYQFLDTDPVVPWLEALLRDLDKSTLKPAMRDGQPVGSSWMVEMDIDLSHGL